MKKTKPYREMSARELQAATSQLDKPFVVEASRPLTPDEKKRWRRIKRRRGRPKTGQGFRRVSVSIEGGLLKQITALAKKRRVSRSKLLAQTLAEVLTQDK